MILDKKIPVFLILIFCSIFLFAQKIPVIEAVSSINWITREFKTNFTLDAQKAKINMPSGKKTASAQINSKINQLTQPALLSLFENSQKKLSDSVIDDELKLPEVYDFIQNGYKTPDIFTQDLKKLQTTNTTNVLGLNELLIHHKNEYTPQKPIDYTPSRKFSGIIIDARGSLPVHGEYVSSETAACFFPTVWDEQMNVVLEKNLVAPEIAKNKGIIQYHYSDNTAEYENIVGIDPLYIKAKKVFGRNRTDPVISQQDALKILTIPENVKLLQEGKVVILLDKKNLIYDISIPQKDNSYYVKYNAIKQYFYENKVPGITVSDSIDGILFSVDLKFYPDSPELLPSEKVRISLIAENLKTLLLDDGYTILVEGHTADVGKPVGQLNLSIERTKTVRDDLVAEGIDSELFTYKGYGGTMPIAPNDTEEGRAQNRRVDITARPKATYIQRDWQ